MKEIPIFISCVIWCALGAQSALASDWQLSRNEDGVSVYQREVPGSDLLAFKGDGDVAAPIEKVATIIFDTTRAAEWIEDLVISKLIRWLSPTEYVEYDHVGTPFIMKDRDFVSKVTIQKQAKALTFSYTAFEDSQVPETSYVRGNLHETVFTLTPGPDGGTHVVGEIHCDPKGSIPKWLVNFFQKDWPVDTFRSLRKQAAKTDIQLDPHFIHPFADR